MKRNILVGVVTILAIVFLYYGMDFLKGASVFSTTNTYYATYDDMGGLVEGAPVYVKGYKVGQVDGVSYDLNHDPAFVMSISIESDVQLPYGSVIELFDDGLLGGRAVQLVLPPLEQRGDKVYADNDTLPGGQQSGLLSAAGNLVPKLESAVEHADSLLLAANTLLRGEELQASLQNIQVITTNFATVSVDLKRISGNATAITEDFRTASRDAKQLVARVNTDMPAIMQNAKGAVANLNRLSGELDASEINATIASAKSTLNQVNAFVEQLNSGDGTVGLLLNDKELYNNLTKTAGSANELVVDLKANPRRYVHFSLFGGKDKSDKTSKKKSK